MSDIAIKVENLSKRYRIGLKDEMPDTLVGAVTQAVKRPLRNWRRLRRLTTFGDDGRRTTDDDNPSSTVHRPSSDVRSDVDRDTLWALKDVSFQVERGEVVGIIGRNGAGKSTLLKVLSRITEPTEGRAVINGRVGSLLEVGTGFHPELTGRENIYLNGAILGMTKDEIDRKFDEIVAFSGVEKFIDTPVKRYSSGMRVRLAFSVAAHLDPEILLIDEVLAVGDAAFQKKCLGKMGDVASEGRTVLFVSHNMASIKSLCGRTLWLDEGMIVEDGSCSEVINAYLGSMGSRKANLGERDDRKGKGQLRFIETWLEDGSGRKQDTFRSGGTITIAARYQASHAVRKGRLTVGFAIKGPLGQFISDLSSRDTGYRWDDIPQNGVVKCSLRDVPLNSGQYTYSIIGRVNGITEDFVQDVATFTVQQGDFFGTGKLPSNHHGHFLFRQNWILEDYTAGNDY